MERQPTDAVTTIVQKSPEPRTLDEGRTQERATATRRRLGTLMDPRGLFSSRKRAIRRNGLKPVSSIQILTY